MPFEQSEALVQKCSEKMVFVKAFQNSPVPESACVIFWKIVFFIDKKK